jgi:predicted nuclease of predicted toxin-antitoxin system
VSGSSPAEGTAPARSAPRLLFDENLAARLVRLLADVYPGSAHVEGLGLLGVPDRAVWARAGADGYVLVTKDEDFHRLSVFAGPPPKVVWIRLGNCSTAEVAQALRDYSEAVRAFAEQEKAVLDASRGRARRTLHTDIWPRDGPHRPNGPLELRSPITVLRYSVGQPSVRLCRRAAPPPPMTKSPVVMRITVEGSGTTADTKVYVRNVRSA